MCAPVHIPTITSLTRFTNCTVSKLLPRLIVDKEWTRLSYRLISCASGLFNQHNRWAVQWIIKGLSNGELSTVVSISHAVDQQRTYGGTYLDENEVRLELARTCARLSSGPSIHSPITVAYQILKRADLWANTFRSGDGRVRRIARVTPTRVRSHLSGNGQASEHTLQWLYSIWWMYACLGSSHIRAAIRGT